MKTGTTGIHVSLLQFCDKVSLRENVRLRPEVYEHLLIFASTYICID